MAENDYNLEERNGSDMVRLKDIAEACGVSIATVSRALNGLTNEGKERTAFICQTAKEMGYYPNAAARTLKTSKSNNIGIIYEDMMTHVYFSTLFDSLRRESEKLGYDLTFIGRGDFTGQQYYENARQRCLDGVIVVQADFDAAGIMHLATSSIPTVIVDHTYEGVDCVTSDNRASMEQIVRHVYLHGHRKIAIIQGQKGMVSRERLAGFYKACVELGVRVPVEYVREGLFQNAVACTEDILELMKLPDRPTCVLCPDDGSAVGAMARLHAKGIKVPEDIALVGYDGTLMSQIITPRLTTFSQDCTRIAQEVFNMLIDAIEYPDTHIPKQVTVVGKIIEGETV